MDNDREQIAAVAAALGCALDDATALYQAGALRRLAVGQTLALQGDRLDTVWLLLDGAIRCEVLSPDGRMTVAATHPPGDLIGAWGMQGEPLAGTLAATGGSALLLSVPESTIDRIAAQSAPFATAIARRYARQSHVMMTRLAARSTLTASGRLCARLIELAGPDLVIRPTPMVSELAVTVQTTRETASRALSTLERRGIIRRASDHWAIQSLRLLEDQII